MRAYVRDKKICSGHMEYIHETSQMPKSHRDDVSCTRKTTLGTLVLGLSHLPETNVV